ncbi:MAG TPA: multicopper oxidase domain-containing protein [Candidatus Binatia bacterium]|nr:multicopper oxidase domain-containing protein [Candidatus Binatia bacterium]
MRAMLRIFSVFLFGVSLTSAWAQLPVCPARPQPGSPVNNPVDLYSQNGVLTVNLTLRNAVDDSGFMHYCYNYMYQGQLIEAPTLRLNPGDRLVLNFTDNIQAPYNRQNRGKTTPMHTHAAKKGNGPADDCSGNEVLPSSTNIHFHGLNVPPVCHQDEIINTVIESGEPAFQYSVQIPANEPPGLYWYHPHVHGNTTTQVDGGASGALIVEGPIPQGLNERILIMREQTKTGPARDPDENTQVTLNFQPAIFPEHGLPAMITMQPGAQEYWRFLNASVRQFTSLQLMYGDQLQQFQVLSIDGVQLQTPIVTDTLYIPPAGRMEFIVPGLPAGQSGTFLTNGFDTGPVGDRNEAHILAQLTTRGGRHPQSQIAHPIKPPRQPLRFSGLLNQSPTTARSLYFSEQNIGTTGGTQFYLTVSGQVPHLFHMDDPPAIVTHVGAVEDWTIENHSGEVHAFHIHQIHFLVMAINGVPLANPYLSDTIIVPNWSGHGPFPSVTLRMDFRDPDIAGTFVYHCHILDHEDGGMMAKIQVNPN